MTETFIVTIVSVSVGAGLLWAFGITVDESAIIAMAIGSLLVFACDCKHS
jgi:uncharacterized membrane protein